MSEIYIFIGIILGTGIFYCGFMLGKEKEKLDKVDRKKVREKRKRLKEMHKRPSRIILRTPAEEEEIRKRLLKRKEIQDSFKASKEK